MSVARGRGAGGARARGGLRVTRMRVSGAAVARDAHVGGSPPTPPCAARENILFSAPLRTSLCAMAGWRRVEKADARYDEKYSRYAPYFSIVRV